MPNSQTIAAFADALEAIRLEVASFNGQIDGLETQRNLILAAPPHSEDIAAVFLRGVNSASADFKRQLSTRLQDSFTGPLSARATGPQSAVNALTLEPQRPDAEALMTRTMRGDGPDLNIAALTYFLRDQIAAEIPSLVDKLCPDARQGMKQADRDQALADIDAQLETLRAQRDGLSADLVAARAAVIR